MATSWLEAKPVAIAKMPEDTLAPLLLALIIGALLTAVLLQQLIWVAVTFVLMLVTIGYWLWPQQEPA